jgi:hypothetical protein
VVGVLSVALLLGWAVMAWADGQTDTFADAEHGLTVRYDDGWLMKDSDNLVLHVLDPEGGEFKTQYQVRAWPIEATGSPTSTLSIVLNNASLGRAAKTTAYRLLNITEGEKLNGGPTMEASFAYVSEGLDLFKETMPIVVQGRDVAILKGDTAYVFTLLAARETFEVAQKAFQRFIDSAELE